MKPTSTKVKILLWAPLGSGTHYWGPGISAYNLLRLMNSDNFEVHLAHGFDNQSDYQLFKSQYFIRKLKFGAIFSMILFLFASRRWLKANASSFDVMYSLSPHHIGILPAVWFKRFGGKKSYIKMTALNDGFNDNSFFSNLFKLPQQRLKMSHKIDGFICLSEEIVDELMEVGIPKSQIFKIPNGVNTTRFRPATKEEKGRLRVRLGLKDSQMVLLFTGGVTSRKAPSLVISAISALVKDYPGLKLLIIGPERDKGQEYARIEGLFKSNPMLRSHVQMIDHLPNIEEYYRVADLFILPSRNEGMSNSVLEALASGLPVIVTPVSGSKEMVVHGENGYIVGRSAQEIGDAILNYLADTSKMVVHGDRSRRVSQERFDANTVVREHEKLFADL